MVKDLFTPNLQSSSYSDKMSDKWLGTNNVSNINMSNNYELQKAVNLNKYSWNVQGMKAAGINPLMATNQLGGVSSSQSSSQQSGETGLLSQVFDVLNPGTLLQDVKDIIKNVLK